MELLHFTAIWCGPCKAMAPIVQEFLNENPDIIYTKIDVDENSAAALSNDVKSIPTFIVKDGSGEVFKRHTGALTKDKFKELFI